MVRTSKRIGTKAALLINRAFGFSVTDSQLLSIPLGVMVVVTYQAMAWAVTKTRQTLLCMIAFTVSPYTPAATDKIPNIVGTIVLITVAPSSATQGGLIVAFYAMQVFQSVSRGIKVFALTAVQPQHLSHALAQLRRTEQKVDRVCHHL